MRRAIILTLVLGWGALPGPAAARPPLRTVMQDDAPTLYRSSAEVAQTLRTVHDVAVSEQPGPRRPS